MDKFKTWIIFEETQFRVGRYHRIFGFITIVRALSLVFYYDTTPMIERKQIIRSKATVNLAVSNLKICKKKLLKLLVGKYLRISLALGNNYYS